MATQYKFGGLIATDIHEGIPRQIDCPECGREYPIMNDGMDEKVGGACPSDDCPSNNNGI